MTEREFNIVVNNYRPKLIFFAASYLREGAATPEDMVQEAVLKLWNYSRKESVKNPSAILVQILKNVCLDYIKLKKNSQDSIDNDQSSYHHLYDSSSSALDILDSKDKITRLNRVLNSMSKDQMLAIRLRDIMGLEMSEIANVLDTSESNVRTLLSRGRKILKDKYYRDGSN